MNFSRRDWVFGALSSGMWSAIAGAQEHARVAARTGTGPLEFFDPAMAADLEAIAELILPSDDGPGAKEAGVIFFVDRALTTFDHDQQPLYRAGLADVRGIATWPRDRQLERLRAIEKTDFFQAVRTHTMLGFLGDPAYGGNRNNVGWTYVGFEHRMSWQPPFGHYDEESK